VLPAWLEIAKPRLIPLLLATTLGGMALAEEGWPASGATIALTLLGGTLASGAAGILNCLWEQDLDGRMQRTSSRALPSGRLAQNAAFGLAISLTVASVLVGGCRLRSAAAPPPMAARWRLRRHAPPPLPPPLRCGGGDSVRG